MTKLRRIKVRKSKTTNLATERSAHSKNRESGAAMLIFVLMVPILMGVAGLVIDVGYLYQYRRTMQTAADAAAMAGAQTLKRKDFANVNTHSLYDAGKNGFDGSGGETRTVNYPPLSGDFVADTNFVEVVITEQVPTFFMGVIGQDTVAVSARGVAGVLPDTACIYVLDPFADKAFEVSSGSNVLASCGVKVSSCSNEALSVTSGSSLETTSTNVCGGGDDGGGTVNPDPNTGVCPGGPCTRGEDPLADIAPPSVPPGCDFTDFKTSSQGTPGNRFQIFPQTYCNGISIESGSHVNFNAGIYYLKGGGLQITSGSTAEGVGVGFYNTTWGGSNYGPINIASGSEARFSAPSGGAGVMDGILFRQDPTVVGQYDNKFESNTNSWFQGTISFPNQHAMFHSNTVGQSLANWSIIIANTLEVSSGSGVEMNANFAGSSPPIVVPALVE